MSRIAAFGLALISSCMLAGTAVAENARTLQIIVSKDKQSLAVYDGDKVVATSKVSTGKQGHDTPTGIFSILDKRKYHESNIYSNAPMPWMQRLTWSGIALHESGSVPNYPASHGCVRLPAAFAQSLYGQTERGVHVIITDAPVTPVLLHDGRLFSPKRPVPPNLMSDVPLRADNFARTTRQLEVAMNMAPSSPLPTAPKKTEATVPEAAPLRILITRRQEREQVADVQEMLNELGFDAGSHDGFAGPMTRSAIEGFKRWKGLKVKGFLTEEFMTSLYAASGRQKAPAGQLMIRQGFKPILSVPVGIKDPETALGTHLFTATDFDRTEGTARWQALTLPNRLPEAMMKRLGITNSDAGFTTAEPAAQQAFDRIEISAELRDRIETMLTSGSSITINDQGVGQDTGEGTDFITLTRSSPERIEATTVSSKPQRADKPARKVRAVPLGVGLY
ncbi:L,D-transpeptidase family protein [Neorhizobium sp. NPDC001467]|uniref:L,D-transpeptidase family protein n=1 Tax=Neorhizobium sp. NPDC001467 TaxID=3390595 RepID=UPI003D04F9AE